MGRLLRDGGLGGREEGREGERQGGSERRAGKRKEGEWEGRIKEGGNRGS